MNYRHFPDHRKSKTFKEILLKIAVRNLALAATLVASFFIFSSQTVNVEFEKKPVEPTTMTPLEVSSGVTAELDSLLSSNRCWNGTSKALANRPTKVIYQSPGMALPELGGEKKVSEALDQIFNKVPHNLIIFAFCV